MTIPWIKCTERMPPDDEKLQILIATVDGLFVGKYTANVVNKFMGKSSYKWVPYDEATWRECCLPVSPDNKL